MNKFSTNKVIDVLCRRIYRAVEHIPSLLESLKTAKYSASVKETFLSPLEEVSEDLSKFQEMISSTLDMDQINKGLFLIKADFSEELSELKASLDYLDEEIQKELGNAARELHLESGKILKLETMPQYGYHFRISNKKVNKINY